MQDPKYQKVRSELDRLKYLEHLGVDSVDLVDRLVKDYTKVYNSFMKLKKKQDPKNEPALANLQHQLDLMNQNYSKNKEENERLRKQLDQGGISEKIRMLESSLNSCRAKYEIQLDELREKLSSSNLKIDELSYSKNSLTEDNQRLRARLEKNSLETGQEGSQLKTLLEKKKKQIIKLQEENSKNRIQINSLERLYQQQKQKWTNSETQATKQSSGALQILRQELDEAEHKLEASRDELSEERQKNRELAQKYRNLTEQLSSVKNNEDYAKSSYSLQASAKSRLEGMLKETQDKNNELREKISILEREKEGNEQEIERQGTKIKQLSNKNNNLMTNMGRMQEQLGVLNTNFTQKVRELREAENKRVTLDKRIQDLESELEEHEESGRNSTQMDNPSNRDQFQKKQAIYEKQIQIGQAEIKVMQENQHHILTLKNKLEVEVKKLHLIISEGNKQLDITREQKQSLMKENKELKSMLNNTESEGYTSKSEAMRLKQTIEQYEIMIEDFKVSIRNEQNINKSHSQKVTELEKQIERKITAHKKMFDDNKQLQMLVTSLEKTKGQLFEKYKMSSEEKSANDNVNLQQRKEYGVLLEERKQLLDRLRSKEVAVSSLSAEYDQLQNELDTLTEQNYALRGEIQKLVRERDNVDKGLGQTQINMQGMNMKIRDLQHELERYERVYHSKCSEFEDACKEINKRKLEVQEYKNEISILVANNKELQKTAERIRINSIDIERKLKDRLNEIDEYREIAGAAKIQNQNLREELRGEKEALHKEKNCVQGIVEEYNNVYNHLEKRDEELKEYQEACRQLQFKENQYVNEINQLERQLRMLGEDLTRKDEEVARLIQDRDVYRAEVSSSRRSYNNTTDWKVIYEDKVQQLESDFAIKRRQYDTIKAELRRNERIIEEERQKNYYLEEELRKYKIGGGQGSQTPIKMFYKSRVESQNWNSYNRDLSDIDNSIELEPDRKFIKNASREVGESFESEAASISSKQCNERLQQIMKQYAATMTADKKKSG